MKICWLLQFVNAPMYFPRGSTANQGYLDVGGEYKMAFLVRVHEFSSRLIRAVVGANVVRDVAGACETRCGQTVRQSFCTVLLVK
jgi:hypothetical protein